MLLLESAMFSKFSLWPRSPTFAFFMLDVPFSTRPLSLTIFWSPSCRSPTVLMPFCLTASSLVSNVPPLSLLSLSLDRNPYYDACCYCTLTLSWTSSYLFSTWRMVSRHSDLWGASEGIRRASLIKSSYSLSPSLVSARILVLACTILYVLLVFFCNFACRS